MTPDEENLYNELSEMWSHLGEVDRDDDILANIIDDDDDYIDEFFDPDEFE
ncbi:MAG: hypothetical protein NC301_04275 [Bacteroides sp.]|nr:hypothetical protein [Bacteroides sp.]MCM1379459.1 hypothetical protein [Bacteroides sp.]MCM1445938.1 hypothetical protein [Prevotella sp.]